MKEKRKTRIGRVINNRMDKTVVVAVDTPKRFPKYRKTISWAIKYKAHDEKNECRIGDVVRIEETRPLSRHKRWRIAEVITKGEAIEVQPKEIAT
jgi:small subunit ribosomal protein S17